MKFMLQTVSFPATKRLFINAPTTGSEEDLVACQLRDEGIDPRTGRPFEQQELFDIKRTEKLQNIRLRTKYLATCVIKKESGDE